MPTKPTKPTKQHKPARHKLAPADGARAGWLRRHRAALAIAVVVAVLGALWLGAPKQNSGAAAATPSGAKDAFLAGLNVQAAPPLSPEAARRRQLTEQFELVDHTLCSYHSSTRYPGNSRPIAEQPDQVYPNLPIRDSHALRKDGGGADTSIQIQTTQSRVYLAAGETAAFSITALDGDGKILPLVITRAVASGITVQGGRVSAALPLAFTDDGNNGDATAGDGTFSGALAPAQSGFAGFAGTIRTEVKYSVAGRNGVVLFDVIYSPDTPATWAGPIREAVEDGSLVFYLKAEIRQAGRYLVSGRLDDAKGQPFALVSFNDVLAVGPNDVRLTAFGKLMRDQAPAMPLTLRDVDGYLLKENTDPDRALMPRIAGTAYVSKTYPAKAFSDTEWSSEERERYLAEYAKDVDLAKAKLAELDPAASALPPSECGAASTLPIKLR